MSRRLTWIAKRVIWYQNEPATRLVNRLVETREICSPPNRSSPKNSLTNLLALIIEIQFQISPARTFCESLYRIEKWKTYGLGSDTHRGRLMVEKCGRKSVLLFSLTREFIVWQKARESVWFVSLNSNEVLIKQQALSLMNSVEITDFLLSRRIHEWILFMRKLVASVLLIHMFDQSRTFCRRLI